jgi:hypothetical protein
MRRRGCSLANACTAATGTADPVGVLGEQRYTTVALAERASSPTAGRSTANDVSTRLRHSHSSAPRARAAERNSEKVGSTISAR